MPSLLCDCPVLSSRRPLFSVVFFFSSPSYRATIAHEPASANRFPFRSFDSCGDGDGDGDGGVLEPAYASLLRFCSNAKALSHGRRIHGHIQRQRRGGIRGDTHLANMLLQMYARCGALQDAQIAFNETCKWSRISWNTMIAAYAHNGHTRNAIWTCTLMLREGIRPNSFTFLPILSSAVRSKSLAEGKRIHAYITSSSDYEEFASDLSLMTALLRMYSECSRIKEARGVFDGILNPDRVCWSSMIMAYARIGNPKQALDLHREMDKKDEKLDKAVFLCLLDTCRGLPSLLENGKRIHRHIVKCGFNSDVVLMTSVLNMYARCGSLKDARLVFDGMRNRDGIAWTAMIIAYARNGHGKEVRELLHRMKLLGEIKLDKGLLLCVINAYAEQQSLENGRALHDYMLSIRFEMDIAVETALINMYGRCGMAEIAKSVFDGMCRRDVISFSIMIAAYAQNGHVKEALELLQRMEELERLTPDRATFLGLVKACPDLDSGRAIHQCITSSGFTHDIAVMTALLDMYATYGSLEDARAVFDEMQTRDKVSWNAMITAYGKHGCVQPALELIKQMSGLEEYRKPEKGVFLCLLNSCRNLEDGQKIEEYVSSNSGFDEFDPAMKNAFISMYSKCNSPDKARSVFDRIPPRFCNTVSWNAMLSAYVQNGRGKDALHLFDKLLMGSDGDVKPDRVCFLCVLNACTIATCLEEGKAIHDMIIDAGLESDIAISNALLNMYGKCGSLKDVELVFDGMRERDVISWGSMLHARVHNGQWREALTLFEEMVSEGGVKPDKAAFLSVISACSSLASLEHGKAIHKYVIESGFSSIDNANIVLMTALLNMYGKCGSLDDARAIFDQMHQPDVSSWNALITAYIQNGLDKEALQLYLQMSVMPNKVTFLCLLTACANMASLQKGRAIHKHIVESGIEQDVALKNAILNMYGKCGSLEDVQSAFDEMEMAERNLISWSALVAAYAQNGKVREALEVCRLMESERVLKPDRVYFLSILNACSHSGLVEEGWGVLVSINDEHGLTLSLDHFVCILDLLGRGGRWVSERNDVVNNMPVQSCDDSVAWGTYLGAC